MIKHGLLQTVDSRVLPVPVNPPLLLRWRLLLQWSHSPCPVWPDDTSHLATAAMDQHHTVVAGICHQATLGWLCC
jgi:hypothetical protein